MRITTILGSPKKNGKTATALKLAEEKLISQGHEITRVNVTEYQIGGCQGCYACMQITDAPGCVLKDDMQSIYSTIISTDALVIASPIYCYELTAQIKPFIDRTFSLSNTYLLNDKPIAGLITCIGEEKGNADLVVDFFNRAFDSSQKSFFNTKLLGTYVVPCSNSKDFKNRAEMITNRLVKTITCSL